MEMFHLGITDLIDNFQNGKLTCEAYTLRTIQRAEDLKVFNYFVSMDTERMLRDAKEADTRYRNQTNRPLEGIPIAFKDNIDIEGEATGAGTLGLAGLKPKHTADVARRLLEAGAIHAGRTNMHELAAGFSSLNSFTGPCHNFHNFDYTCGGSSGGSAGVVVADIVPAAVGTDTAGSVRIPSSYSGVFGLRPTKGRWPSDYGVKMTNLRDTIGPLTRSSKDIAILDSLMTGEKMEQVPSPGDIRIGIPRSHFWEDLNPEVQQFAERFLGRLKQAGFVIIDEGEIPGVQEMAREYLLPIIAHELIPRLREYLKNHGHDVTAEDVVKKIASPDVSDVFQAALEDPPDMDIIKSGMAIRDNVIIAAKTYFSKHNLDCILVPASKIVAPSLEAARSGDHEDFKIILDNHDMANMCNHPSLVLPGGFARGSGAPFGMQIEAMTGSDCHLIAVARAIEKAFKE